MSIIKDAKQSLLALALVAMALAFACGGGGDATPQDTPVSEEPGDCNSHTGGYSCGLPDGASHGLQGRKG